MDEINNLDNYLKKNIKNYKISYNSKRFQK